MKFSQPALSRLLREAGLTVWSSQRPSTLAWIVIDNGSGAIQADQYEQGLGQRLVESAARDRGVPVILPLMDLQDQMAYDPARIVALDMDGLTAASLRYKPDAILLGSITRKDDMLWSAQWSLRLRDRVTRFDASGDTLEAAVDAGLAATVRTMVAVYTVNTTVQQAPAVITLAVQAINDFPRYRRMLGLLQDMEPVKKVSVQKIEADEVLYQLDIVGNTQLVADLLALSGSLRPVAVPDTKAGAAINQQDPQRKRPDLYYRWE